MFTKSWLSVSLGCVSILLLIVSIFLVYDRGRLLERRVELERTVAELKASRDADKVAMSMREELIKEAHDAAQCKQRELDRLTHDMVGLDDSAFLDLLHRVLSKDGNSGSQPSPKPAGTVPAP